MDITVVTTYCVKPCRLVNKTKGLNETDAMSAENMKVAIYRNTLSQKAEHKIIIVVGSKAHSKRVSVPPSLSV